MITFALDPVTDQQNIADAFSLRRDLQIAMAYSFATGQINFSQLNRFRRRIEEDAETIALNRTVTAYAHGNETFGWRFYPRFQNPPVPVERTNFGTLGNLLARGGPPPDYRARYSRLETGQRELTVIMIMPSFLQRARFDVSSNWFKLNDPDDFYIPTAKMLWQGQELMKLRNAVAHYCDPRLYRPGDLERVLVKIDRVEDKLPLQTEFVRVPYENMQSGFQLFTPGLAALVPELLGYEGLSHIEADKGASLFLYAKNVSIHETRVIAGGQYVIPDENVEILSREVVRVTLNPGLLATLRKGVEDPNRIEFHLATPNGISNRLLVPFDTGKDETPAPTIKSGYEWSPAPSVVAYVTYDDRGVVESLDFEGDLPKDRTEIVANTNFLGLAIPEKLTRLGMRVTLKNASGEDEADNTAPSEDLDVAFSSRGRAEVPFTAVATPLDSFLREKLRRSQFGDRIEGRVATYIRVDDAERPIKLDNTFDLTIIVREPRR